MLASYPIYGLADRGYLVLVQTRPFLSRELDLQAEQVSHNVTRMEEITLQKVDDAAVGAFEMPEQDMGEGFFNAGDFFASGTGRNFAVVVSAVVFFEKNS
jgi:hypothetical protein